MCVCVCCDSKQVSLAWHKRINTHKSERDVDVKGRGGEKRLPRKGEKRLPHKGERDVDVGGRVVRRGFHGFPPPRLVKNRDSFVCFFSFRLLLFVFFFFARDRRKMAIGEVLSVKYGHAVPAASHGYARRNGMGISATANGRSRIDASMHNETSTSAYMHQYIVHISMHIPCASIYNGICIYIALICK